LKHYQTPKPQNPIYTHRKDELQLLFSLYLTLLQGLNINLELRNL
jgi:hypothetical protein